MATIVLRGTRLRDLLQEAGGDTNVAAGEILGLNNGTVSRVLSGASLPGPRLIAAALTALPATFDELFEVRDDTEAAAS